MFWGKGIYEIEMNEKPTFLLVIECMTYNQSAYITDAMNGFVMQQTDFPFVAVIVDDASTDGEQEVIRKYVDENFDHSLESGFKEWETEDAFWTFARHSENKSCHFVVVYLKKNLWKEREKKAEVIKDWCKTKYVALCEGDDYWIDPLKLQKQVGYLQEHDECIMCTHAAYWNVEGEMKKWGCQHEEECDLTTDEVIRDGGLYLATCSLVFRNEINEDWPEWRRHSAVGDFPLQILGSLRGKLHFFPGLMGVYRFQAQGSFTSLHKEVHLDYAKNQVESLELLDEETGHIYQKAINTHLYMWYRPLYLAKEIGTIKYLSVGIHSYGKLHKVVKDIIDRKLHLLFIIYSKIRSL